jgi:hypothetical protein
MVTLSGCKPSEPARPTGVPRSAIWAGGADGGAFFLCSPSTANEANACTVYNDSTGDVYMSGNYLLKDKQRGARVDELHYSAADGDRIYLEHNLILIADSKPGSH